MEVNSRIFGARVGILFLKKFSLLSMVNLRPHQNRAMEILDPTIREQVKRNRSQVIRRFTAILILKIKQDKVVYQHKKILF
jgi:hypothetical protein